jgi:TRAP-type C4-dicarboxylate transport system permease small subunit
MTKRVSTFLEKAGVALAGLSLFGIMALTFFDVLGRKFFAASIPGSLELTELLMVLVIFGALPAVSRRSEHVQFDSLDALLPAGVRKVQRVLVALVACALMAAVASIMWTSAREFLASGETTAQLHIAKAPFIFAMSLFCAIAAAMRLDALRGEDPSDAASPGGLL